MDQTLNDYIRERLSPTETERSRISRIYEELRNGLPGNEVFQSGSYARFTSITPVSDLDVIWVIPDRLRDEVQKATGIDASKALTELAKTLESYYTRLAKPVTIKIQSHSIGIYFGTEEDFSIDIVPALKTSKSNEFGDPIYQVPEVQHTSRSKRQKLYTAGHGIRWIFSDPKGYKEACRRLNEQNDSFRKATKFCKAWKRRCKQNWPLFPLKSFHIEMLLHCICSSRKAISTSDAIANFFSTLPEAIQACSIRDRAEPSTFIDEYVNEIDEWDKREIVHLAGLAARRLRELGNLGEDGGVSAISSVISGLDSNEQSIMELVDGYADDLNDLCVRGKVRPHNPGGYREYWLHEQGNRVTGVGRKIEFSYRAKQWVELGAKVVWKVKNRPTNKGEELRGQLNNLQTPESTAYKGQHFVDCYVIKNRRCTAFGRQYVVIAL